jgi:hypothetical protein
VCGHSAFTAHTESAFKTIGLAKVKRRSIFQARSDNLKNGAYRAVPQHHQSSDTPLNEKPSQLPDLAFCIFDGVAMECAANSLLE